MQAMNRYSGGDAYRLSLWPDEDGEDAVMRELFTTRDACYMLNVDVKTLRRWARELGIEPPGDTADKRVSGWTRPQLATLARRHHRVLGEPPAEREPSRVVRELIARVQALEGRVARLEGQQLAPRSENVTRPLPRQIATTARHTGKLPLLPEGAVTFRQLVLMEFGVDERTAVKWINAGELPEPTRGGQWFDPQTKGVASRIYLEEQIPAARAALERLTGRTV